MARRRVFLTALAAGVLFASTAFAQIPPDDQATPTLGVFLPRTIGQEDLNRYRVALQLSDAQIVSIKDLHTKYQADWSHVHEECSVRLRQMSSLAWQARQPRLTAESVLAHQALADEEAECVQRLAAIDRAFFGTIELLLSTDQLAGMPAVRADRQRTASNIGRRASSMEAAMVDLETLAIDRWPEAPNSPLFVEAIIRYSQWVGPKLADLDMRHRRLRIEFDRVDTLAAGQVMTPEMKARRAATMTRLRQPLVSLKLTIVKGQAAFAQNIAASMPPEAGRAFAADYLAAAFPAAWPDPVQAHEAVNEIAADPNTSIEIRAALQTILAGHGSAMDACNQKIINAYTEWLGEFCLAMSYRNRAPYREKLRDLLQHRCDLSEQLINQAEPLLQAPSGDKVATLRQCRSAIEDQRRLLAKPDQPDI